MISIFILGDLPFVKATVAYRSKKLTFNHVLLDTGSAGTVFHAEKLIEMGVYPELDDMVILIRGVGGVECVYLKRMDSVSIGDHSIQDFEIEISAMNYGFDFEVECIIGFDAMQQLGIVIDIDRLEVYKKKSP